MRSLTEPETKTLFEKLANYTGRSLNHIIAPPTPTETKSGKEDRFVFRLHASRVYYVRLSIANLATSVARTDLLSLGTCIGKFTKTGKFRLHITALDVIAPHARYKVWVKPNGEMPYLYGGNVVKAHVGRWSEDCPEHSGVLVLGMDDTPLGFGVTARSTAEARRIDPTGVVTFRQSDIGEYLREVSHEDGYALLQLHMRLMRNLQHRRKTLFSQPKSILFQMNLLSSKVGLLSVGAGPNRARIVGYFAVHRSTAFGVFGYKRQIPYNSIVMLATSSSVYTREFVDVSRLQEITTAETISMKICATISTFRSRA